jgi:hypothetical protein
VVFPKKICSICSEEFELRPDKPGFANRCPACSEEDDNAKSGSGQQDSADSELSRARRAAMRDLLYRKDS